MVFTANELEAGDFHDIVIDDAAEKQAALLFRWIDTPTLKLQSKRFDNIQS